MRIGILTGGGDVPGLNACIKSVVGRAADNDWEVIGFRRGWAGPLYLDPGSTGAPSDAYAPLERRLIKDIDRTGGTILHTSRTNPAKVSASAWTSNVRKWSFDFLSSEKSLTAPSV